MKTTHRAPVRGLLLAVSAALIMAMTARAAGESLIRSTITAAGGQATVNGIGLRSAVGEPIAGILAGSDGRVCAGVLCGPQGTSQATPEPSAGANLFMPLLSR